MGLNYEFTFSYIGCYNKVKESSLPYNLSIAYSRIVQSLFAQWEIKTASLRIWTQITRSFFYDYNHYALTLRLQLENIETWEISND